jgi:hypothetical protein
LNLSLLRQLDAPTSTGPDCAGLDAHRLLSQLCSLASNSNSGLEAAAVILLHHGLPAQHASSGYARAADRIQYRTGEGPCVDAAAHGCTVVSGHLGSAEIRWPQFVAATRALSVSSVLSVPLGADHNVIGTLNLYSRRPDAFDDTAVAAVQRFAHRAAGSVSEAWSPDISGEALIAVRELPAELVHGIEAVVGGMADPALRSATISRVVEEIFETLSWALGEPAQQVELSSFTEVLAAAYAHEDRVTAVSTNAGAR